jgi:uncharacterized protein YdhG (YjbR/CyaY superfamily)
MATKSGDRAAFFPAIEKKHGRPMAYWFDLMAERAGQSYGEQLAYLVEEHGFSRAHANALVMYCRGSTSSRRFDTVDEYLASVEPTGAGTVRAIFATIVDAHPELRPVIAWNQPMLRRDDGYVFGVSVQSRHILLGPWGDRALDAARPLLEGYTVNKKTVQVPLDWTVDRAILLAMVESRLAELGGDRD